MKVNVPYQNLNMVISFFKAILREVTPALDSLQTVHVFGKTTALALE